MVHKLIDNSQYIRHAGERKNKINFTDIVNYFP